MRSEELLDEFFFSYDFREVTSSFLQEEFEINKVHEAGGYSPEFYSFSRFWLTYSLFRGLTKNSFIPSKDSEKSTFTKSMIGNMISLLDKISHEDLMPYLKESEVKIKICIESYKVYLKELLND